MVANIQGKGGYILHMIELRIKGKKFNFFSSVDVNLKIDSIASTFKFNGFFDISDVELKDIFKPFTYADCQVWFIDQGKGINERLITGTILNPALSLQRQKRLTGVSGYSRTGLFEDINLPVELYPLQFDGLSLKQISEQICNFFNIPLLIFDNAKEDAAKPFELVKAEPSQTIKDFLSKMARDRNITITHDNFGRLLLYKILDITPPKIKINETDSGVVSISVSPSAQGVHSSITIINQASTTDQNEGQTTVQSPFMQNQNRPLVKMLTHGTGTDTKEAANAIASAEAKSFPITIELEGWTFQDKIVRAGFYIELTAPSIFIDTTKLVLQSVNFKEDPKTGKTQTLIAILPCVYTGKLPTKNPFK